MNAQETVDIKRVNVGVWIVCGVLCIAIVGGSGFSWWWANYLADIKIETKAAIQEVRDEGNKRMDRIERTLEQLIAGLETIKKNAADAASEIGKRTAGRWTRLHEYVLCERHATAQQKKNGMCSDILHIPFMTMTADSFNTSWQPTIVDLTSPQP